jgi:frataxin-like iron-binding protein CyaY
MKLIQLLFLCGLGITLSFPLLSKNTRKLFSIKSTQNFNDYIDVKVEAEIGKVVAKILEKIDAKFDEANRKADSKFEVMNTRFEELTRKVDVRFEEVNKKVDVRFEEFNKKVDAKFEEVNKKVDNLNLEFSSGKIAFALVGFFLSGLITTNFSVFLQDVFNKK